MTENNTSTGTALLQAFAILAPAIVILNSICTQYIAGELGYLHLLGSPIWYKWYNPFDWWRWMFSFYGHSPKIFGYATLIFCGGLFVTMMALKLSVGLRSRSAKGHEGIHGTAHFATSEEVQETGLIPKPGKLGAGVYCAAYEHDERGMMYLRDNSNEHIAVIAPTGSGKGVGNVITTLLSWPESVVIIDIKGENYELTAGWRQKHAGNRVLKLNLSDSDDSCHKNPLSEIRLGTKEEIEDAKNMALMLVDNDGKGLEGDHWRESAYQLISGVIIYALYKKRTVTLEDCSYLLKGELNIAVANEDDENWRPLSGLFLEMQHFTLEERPRTQRFIRGIGARMGSNTPAKELGSIISTACTKLELYCGENVSEVTSKTDFMISDLMDAENPVSLYIVINPTDINRLRPLTRLLLNLIKNGLTGPMKFQNGRAITQHKHRLLLIPDEFPALGKLEEFETALAFFRGYGIKVVIVIQDMRQLYKHYTKYESIISNCKIQIIYAPNNQETAELVSKMAGQTTIVKEQISTSGSRFGGMLKNVSRGYQEISRPLITPDEVQRLEISKKDENGNITEPGEILVFMAGHPVIKGKQILYFQDPVFNSRSRVPPPKNGGYTII